MERDKDELTIESPVGENLLYMTALTLYDPLSVYAAR